MIKLDRQLYALLTHHLRDGKADMTEVLAIMSNHITMTIQCVAAPPNVKLSLAKQVMECVVNEIEKDPNPMARRLN